VGGKGGRGGGSKIIRISYTWLITEEIFKPAVTSSFPPLYFILLDGSSLQ
jgi:hypothetical protein